MPWDGGPGAKAAFVSTCGLRRRYLPGKQDLCDRLIHAGFGAGEVITPLVHAVVGQLAHRLGNRGEVAAGDIFAASGRCDAVRRSLHGLLNEINHESMMKTMVDVVFRNSVLPLFPPAGE